MASKAYSNEYSLDGPRGNSKSGKGKGRVISNKGLKLTMKGSKRLTKLVNSPFRYRYPLPCLL